MAFTITQFGRVEIDPGRIPVSQATRDVGRQDPGNTFGRELDRAEADRFARDRQVQRRDFGAEDADRLAAERQAAVRNHDDAATRSDDSLPTDPQAAAAAGATAAQQVDAADTTTDTPEGEAPTSRNDNGKGAGASPSLFSRDDGDTESLAPGSRSPARANDAASSAAWAQLQATPPAPLAGNVPQNAAVTSASSTHFGVPAHGVTAQGGEQRATASQATVGYRSMDANLLRQAEDARDSIFRQIAMRLTPTGGEMVVLVDPPELGELEMKLVVEGDKLKLTIHAERPEIAIMMQKHLAELRQHLAAQGLTITDAQVHTRNPDTGRGDRAGQGGDSGERDHGFGKDASSDADASGPGTDRAPQGFITADGFDFWV